MLCSAYAYAYMEDMCSPLYNLRVTDYAKSGVPV